MIERSPYELPQSLACDPVWIVQLARFGIDCECKASRYRNPLLRGCERSLPARRKALSWRIFRQSTDLSDLAVKMLRGRRSPVAYAPAAMREGDTAFRCGSDKESFVLLHVFPFGACHKTVSLTIFMG